MKTLLTSVLVSMPGLAGSAGAADYRFTSLEFAPFIQTDGGKAVGPFVEIITLPARLWPRAARSR